MESSEHLPLPASPRRSRNALQTVTTVLVVTVCVLNSLIVFGLAGTQPATDLIEPSRREVLGLLAGLAAAVSLIWRHRHPEVVTFAAAVPPLVFITDSLAAIISLAALAARRRDRVFAAGVAAVFTATLVAVEYDSRRHPEISPMQWMFGAESEGRAPEDVSWIAVVAVAAILTAIPLPVGIYRRTHREIAEQADAQRALLAEKARHDERTRIAREMHDVLGHRLSLLSLQAGALEVGDDVEGGEAARTIRRTARQSMDDLRQMIGVLRDGGTLNPYGDEPPIPFTPPSLGDLPELIDATCQAGLSVNATIFIDDASTAPSVLATAAYRIVQEALTNVARHAPGTTAQVRVVGRPATGVSITVTNPLSDHLPSESIAGSGTGLVSMTERATALGGTVNSGPDGDQFTVTVWLPWPAPQ